MIKLANDNHLVMVDDNPGDVFLAHQCKKRSKVKNAWMSFSNGPEFLAYLALVRASRAPMPALVLLDINMPGMTGIEVLVATRADPFFDQLPIFCMLTSSSDPEDRQRAKALGASGFFTKPSEPQRYVAFFDSLV